MPNPESLDQATIHTCQSQNCFKPQEWQKVTKIKTVAPYSGFGRAGNMRNEAIEVYRAYHIGEPRPVPRVENNFWWDCRGTTIQYYLSPRSFAENPLRLNRG